MRLLRPEDVAEQLAISRTTLDRTVEKGEIAVVIVGTGRGQYRFLQADVDAYINRRRRPAVAEQPVDLAARAAAAGIRLPRRLASRARGDAK